MEEGLALVMNGGRTQHDNAGAPSADRSGYVQFNEDDDQTHIEKELRNNPLQGIADSVVGDIMSGQVRLRVCCCCIHYLKHTFALFSSALISCTHNFVSTHSMFCTDSPGNSTGTLPCVPFCNRLERTFYHRPCGLAGFHVFPLPVCLTAGS